MSDRPEWLGHDLVGGTLPWDHGVPSSLAAFLDRFTLRDAEWIGLYSEPRQQATLLLHCDALRSDGEEPLPGGVAPEGLLLAIRFDALDRVEVKLRHSRITSAVSGATSRAANMHRTHFEDRRGGGATLYHAPNVRILCLTRDRAALSLPVAAETL